MAHGRLRDSQLAGKRALCQDRPGWIVVTEDSGTHVLVGRGRKPPRTRIGTHQATLSTRADGLAGALGACNQHATSLPAISDNSTGGSVRHRSNAYGQRG